MGKRKDITGQRFGRLIAVRPDYQHKSGRWMWLCRCNCGNDAIVGITSLLRGTTQSCGCYNIDRIKERQTKHGKAGTRIHNIHSSIKQRCFNSNYPEYQHYGGRGITVCEDWLDFINFDIWAVANGYTEDLTIERMDVNGNYCPENCIWIPKAEQADNKQTTIKLTYKGETKTLTQWAKKLDVSREFLYNRVVVLGWDVERAIETIKGNTIMILTYKGETKPIRQWEEETGLDLYNRIYRKNWTLEEAFNTPRNKFHKKVFKKEDELITFNGKTLSLVGWSEDTGIPLKTLKSRLFTKKWSIERTLTEPMHTNMVR